MAKDFYQTLGVGRDATDDDIKKAYRKLAHQHHPDKKGGDEARFKEINEAYQVLSDKKKRQQYDQFGSTFRQTPSGGPSGFEGFDFGNFDFSGFSGRGGSQFEDIFSDFFGGGRRNERGTRRGSDIQVDVELDFAQMLKGAEKKIRLYKSVQCSSCKGSGGEPGTNESTCSKCSGSGKIRHTQQTFLGSFSQVAICDACQGKGRSYSSRCKKCAGDGRVKQEDEITVQIPAGIDDGQTVSVSEKGEAGEYGAPSGNLYITVHVKPHGKFHRRASDLLSDEHIPFSVAVLGGKINIETIEESVSMKIPAGTQSGEVFRIKHGGFSEIGGRGRGNHLVRVVVDIPKKLSWKQKKIIEDLSEQGL